VFPFKLKKGDKETGELRIVRLSGDPYSMGYQHGQILKKEIREIYKKAEETLCYHEGKYIGKVAFRVVHQISKYLNKFIPDEFKKEIQGIVDGAGLKYYDILLMNLVEELDVFYFKYFRSIFSPRCSCFVAKNNKGILIVGRNLDYDFFSENLPSLSVLLVYFPKDGFPFASLIWPGIISAFTSFSKNLNLFIFDSPTKHDGWKGMPEEILTRKIIQYSLDFDSAIKEINSSSIPRGQNLVLVSKENAIVTEFSPFRKAVRSLSDYLIVTNHFQAQEMKDEQVVLFPKLRKTMISEEFYTLKGSEARAEKLNLLCREKPIDIERAKDILKAVSTASTVQSIIFIPKEGELYIATSSKPPVTKGEWIHLNLNELI